MKTIAVDSKNLVLTKDASSLNNGRPERYLARGRVGLFANAPNGAEVVDVKKVVSDVAGLGDEIKAQLVAMDEAIDMVLIALIAGETIFLLSKPGAAKSTLGRLVAEGVGGKYFRSNLNPKTSMNDLFGSIDPKQITEKGEWRRKLAGLGTASVAMTDEVFKASEHVQDMLLEAFEEHTYSDGYEIHNLPLILGIAASNELVNDNIENAFWDRLIIRLKLEYPVREDDWFAILRSTHGMVPITTQLDPEEIMLVQGYVEYRAEQADDEPLIRMVEIKKSLMNRGIETSPRRLQAWARVAMAKALMCGNDVLTFNSLDVGEHILWMGQDDIEDAKDIVCTLSNPERGILREAEADLELVNAKMNDPSTDLVTITRWQANLNKHLVKVNKDVKDPDLSLLKTDVIEGINKACEQLIPLSAQLMEREAERDGIPNG